MAALTGTLVVSLEQAVAAPYCARLLAEAGARVLKIEREEGDFARHYDTVVNGESAYFVWLNGGKESIVMDVKDSGDIEWLKRLIARADVFIQNIRPGAVERLGLGWAEVEKINPRVVMCSISGYGDAGDIAEMKAYDFLVQAETGLCSVTGTPGEPSRVGVSVCDISTGLTAYAEILRALLERGHTGHGQHVEVSLFDVMAEWMSVPLAYYKYGQRRLTGTGLDHTQIAPYGAHRTKDGLIIIAVQNQREWVNLCQVLGNPALADDARFNSIPLRVQNRTQLTAEIETFFVQYTRAELAERLDAGDIAYGRINHVDDVWQHRALKTKEVRSQGQLSTFVRRACDPGTVIYEVPTLGQHTAAVKIEFGV